MDYIPIIIAKNLYFDMSGILNNLFHIHHEFIIDGIHTNIEFQNSILNHKDYIAGEFDTSFLENNLINRNRTSPPLS